MINGVHHISISTLSIDPMLAFYGDIVGLSVMSRRDTELAAPAVQTVTGLKNAGYRHAWLSGGNVVIEIFEYTTPRGEPGQTQPACDAGIRHICFDVTDLASEYARMKAAGVVFVTEPQLIESAASWSVYGYDPDGNMFELQEILPASKITARIETFAPLSDREDKMTSPSRRPDPPSPGVNQARR